MKRNAPPRFVFMPLHERPQVSKVFLVPFGIDDEIAGDAVPVFTGSSHRVDREIDGRVLRQTFESGVGGRFEAEENVEYVGHGPPGFEQFRVPRHQIRAALHQDPALPNPAALQLVSKGQTSRRLIPEEIVSDENMK